MRREFRCLISSFLLLYCLGCSDQTIPLVTPNGAWQKQGVVIEGGPNEQYSVQEPSVLYENGNFEMWFTCGWSIEGMCYATSPDGINWTRPGNGLPLIQNVAHGFVTKIGSIYYYYAAIVPASKYFGRWHSTDRMTWTQDTGAILPATGTGWESGQRGNIYVLMVGNVWYALYEALGSDVVWRTGVATSPDGISWTESNGNPKLEFASKGMCGGPEVHNVSGLYYIWEQCSRSGFNPTDIYRFQSPDLNSFSPVPEVPAMARTTLDEGINTSLGQVADPSMVEVNGNTYMFYSATDNQNPTPGNGIHLKLAIATMPISQLVTTTEGTRATNNIVGGVVSQH